MEKNRSEYIRLVNGDFIKISKIPNYLLTAFQPKGHRTETVDKLAFLESAILSGRYTRKGLSSVYQKVFGGSYRTPMTLLTDCKNPKYIGTRYNPFNKVILEDKESKLISFATYTRLDEFDRIISNNEGRV